MNEAQVAAPATGMLWTGRVISGLVVVFMIFDGVTKILRLAPVVAGTVQAGYPERMVVPIGIAALVSALLYALPRTAVLGAILLTGFLGGATATNVRLASPWFVFPVGCGVLVWLGLYLRDLRLRALLPLQRSQRDRQ